MRNAAIVTGLLFFAAAGCGSTVTEPGSGEAGGQTEDRGVGAEDSGRTDDGGTASEDATAADATGTDVSHPADASDLSDTSDAGDDGGTPYDAGQDAGTAEDTGHDAGMPVDAAGDAGHDAGTPHDAGHDASTTDAGTATLLGTLAVNCDVSYVLDASKISNMTYMASHFSDLVQQYCITGTVGGVDIASYAEKMYFGSHASGDPILSLTQMSMISVTSPQYSVKVDFDPDSAVTQGSVWQVGPEAMAAVIKHITAQQICLLGWGEGGSLTFGAVQGVTQIEGGSFSVSGSMDIVDPRDITDLCAVMPAELPCCQ
ncbi:MAG: hypothetical protein HY897_04480 [Deltaproteobacteria bacterium]|nr:hypothetical protein [Deltaproteobacteria bacterium]